MDNEMYEFLMFELSDVVEEFDNDGRRAEEIMIILSAIDGVIPEVYYRLYTAPLNIDQSTIQRALEYYSGIGEVKVECDCDPEDKSICDIYSLHKQEYYQFGSESVNKTSEWYVARNRIQELKADLRG